MPEKLTSCPNPVGYLFGDNGKVKAIGCKSNTCPYCGPIKRMKVLNDVGNAFKDQESVYFVTLTLRHSPGNRRQNKLLNANAAKYWARLRTRLNRMGYNKDTFKWFYTIELTQRGMIHYHILWNIDLTKDDEGLNKLIRAWYEATDKTSYIVHPEKTQIIKPSGYMLKYLTKAFEFDLGDKKIKRYGFSRNITRERFKPDSRYFYVPKYAYDPALSPLTK